MEQNIRKLFNEYQDLKNTLPVNHREEFLEKLQKLKTPKRKYAIPLKIAMTLVIGISITYSMLLVNNQNDTSSILTELKTIEAKYLEEISLEWRNFTQLTKDNELIKRHKNNLENLSTQYNYLSKQFKSDANNIFLLENLIANLRKRLFLLKRIQNHIQILNSKNNHHEQKI